MIKSTLSILIISSLLLFTACGSSTSGGSSSTISNQNNIPIINTNFSNFSLLENNGTTSYDISISDIYGDKLTLSIESNNTNILTVTKNFINPLLQANYNGQTLSFNLTTEQNASGVVRITITVDDGDKNSTTSFDVNVTKIFRSGDKWKGFEYNTITSQVTNRVWLDRNLGASQACTQLDDSACFGDYYQWGRNTDGHEKSNSKLVNQEVSISVNSGYFVAGVVSGEWAREDSNGSIRSTNWSKIDGTSICPVGYRVPTRDEFVKENIISRGQAYSSVLKFPSAGYREISRGDFVDLNSLGYLWSSSPDADEAEYFTFTQTSAGMHTKSRANGIPVRCVKH
ncbi:hypothetical protein MNB_ARC-1_622 [hydrothermal vent metagenome]|uniref:Uncharacterized protein n=1 Tax=hydrothermal vent metagenome TaxID=652676 RepID=A0A3B1E617_9ZZZZ